MERMLSPRALPAIVGLLVALYLTFNLARSLLFLPQNKNGREDVALGKVDSVDSGVLP